MVSGVPLIEVRLGDYVLSAVRHGDPPPPGSDGSTFISYDFVGQSDPPTIQVGGESLKMHGSAGRLNLANPMLGENSKISIYVDGPIPTSIKSEPRADSVRHLFGRKGFQHFEVQYRGAVGDVAWRWETPIGTVTIGLECFPTKLDYRKDFASIRAALEALAPSLTASVSGAAAGSFGTTRDQEQSADVEWLQMVRRHHVDLRRAVARLLPRLRRQIQPMQAVTTRERMRRAKPISRRGYAPGRPSAAILVSSLVDGESSPVNGHLKWELERLRAAVLGVTTAQWFGKLDPNLRLPVMELGQEANAWLHHMQHIPTVMHLPNMQVRMRDPLYDGAFRSLHSLRRAIEPLADAHPVGLKDLPTLYEYWVFLRVVEMLRHRYPVASKVSEPLVQRAGADLVLTPGRASEIVLEDGRGGEVRCQFNRLFTGLPTTNQRPDAVISIHGADRLLLIDAKYRLGRDPDYVRRYGQQGPLAEDINVIHRYRDAVVSTLAPHRRLSQAGLIAFPGKEASRYLAHQFYRSWMSVRVAGMPMLPSNCSLMEQTINDYLDEINVELTA